MEQLQHERIYHLVYQTRCTVNNKIYVGVHSTNDLDDGYLGSGTAIRAAIKKYGRRSFERIVLYECKTSEEAYAFEIAIVNSTFVARNDTYNLSTGGCGMGMLGKKMSAESISKFKKAVVGIPKSTEHRAKLSQANMGHTFEHTEETKEKIRRAHTGKKKSAEHTARIWASRRANAIRRSI